MSRPEGGPSGRAHNKSGQSTLGVCDAAAEVHIDRCLHAVTKSGVEVLKLSRTMCLLQETPRDGRYTHGQRKHFYVYQAVAYARFGRQEMLKVTTSKIGTDLTISHVCGTHHCLAAHHLMLEPKHVNDDRVHCHVFLGRVSDASERHALAERHCPHLPRCYSV